MSNNPKVYLGIGHGGSDPGAVANGIKEKDANLVIGKAAAAELERHGVEVMLSRTTDISESTSAKVQECNAFKPNLAGDIHNNAGGGDGAEVYHSINGGEGKELAEKILEEVVAIGQNSRGAKTRKGTNGDYYGFIRGTNCPAVIVECAFLDNKNDVQIIDTVAEQQAMGVAIAKGFLRQLKITHKAQQTTQATPATPAPSQTATASYRVQVGSFGKKAYAMSKMEAVKSAGFDAYVVSVDGKLWRVQIGDFATKAEADKLMEKVLDAGFSGYVTKLSGAPVTETTTTPKKSVDDIAREVIQGKWGNGADRKKRLEAAGYDYDAIQKRVNQLL